MDISYTVYSFLTGFYLETPPSLQIVSSHVWLVSLLPLLLTFWFLAISCDTLFQDVPAVLLLSALAVQNLSLKCSNWTKYKLWKLLHWCAIAHTLISDVCRKANSPVNEVALLRLPKLYLFILLWTAFVIIRASTDVQQFALGAHA